MDEVPNTEAGKPLLAPRRIAIQLAGWMLGLGLLAWVIYHAVSGDQAGGWNKLREADPSLIIMLIGCTLASLAANGTIFWLVIRPVQPLRWRDMQLLNLATSILNYAPVRAGLIARIAYHLRVDRMSVLLVGGWFAAVGYTLAVTLGAVVVATILRPQFDWMWLGLLGGQMLVGGAIARTIFNLPVVRRIGKGMDRMLTAPGALWGAIALRLVDVAAFAGRVACAAAILDLPLTASQTLLVAVAAIAVSLNPLGRVGYREVGVAFFAGYLAMSGEEFEAARNQLALIESAGEAVVSIPLGAVSLLWYRKRWMQAAHAAATNEQLD